MSFTKFTLSLLLVLFCFSSLAFSQSSSSSTITKCRPKDRLGTLCSLVVDPVCGYKPDIVCTGSPCNYITYSNACEACHDPQVASYTQGKCPQTINPPPLDPPVVPPPLIPPPADNPDATKCRPKDRLGKICPMVVDPVCGFKPNIVCTGSPCNYVTYSNSCKACHDAQVVSYTKGSCPQVVVPPPLIPPIVPPPLIPKTGK